MNRIVSTILTVTLALLLPLTAMAAPIGKATFIKGSVDITSPGKDAKPLQVNDDIEINDVIRTKSASKAEITFIDDSIMRVAERSRVEVQNYVINNESLNGTVKLYRGKIQNIVSTTGKAFGRLQQNKFEVHTPMAVVGVRGTNFFTYHQQFTGSTFQEGHGYGFSVGNPDQMITITAGQSMVVKDVNQVPEVKEATKAEMGDLNVDTAPEDEQGGKEGGTGGDTAAAGDTGETDEAAANDAADAATDKAADAAATEAGAPDAGGPAGGEPGPGGTGPGGAEPGPGPGSGGAEPGPGPGAGPAPGGMNLNLSLGDLAPTMRTAPGTTAVTPTGTAPNFATAALPGVLSPAAGIMTPPPITTTIPTTIYIPPPTTTTNTTTPQPFASTLSGSTYKLTAGTMVEDEKHIYDVNGYETKEYRYEYFYTGASIPFGSRDFWDSVSSPNVDWWEVYLPDSHYWKFNGLYPVPMVTAFSNWTVGSKAIADFTTNPTAEAWLTRVYDDYTSISTFVGSQYGTITGTMTGQNVFTATAANPAAITLGGNTTVATDLLFKMTLSSNSTTVGGAYEGYLGGIINSLLYGGITAIYVNDAGEAGFLNGIFAGTASGTTWGGGGAIYHTAMVSSTGVTPATLAANIDTGFIYGEFKGGIIGDADSRLYNTGTGTTKSIRGQDWGIYALSFMLAPRAKNVSNPVAWSGRVSGEAAFGTYQNSGGTYIPDSGIWMSTDIAGVLDTPEAGMFMSSYAGYFMTPFKIGTMGGTIRGAYTGTDDQWLATSGGTWEATQDLYFNGAFDSSAWQYGRNHTFKTMAYQQNKYVSGNSYYQWAAYDGVNSGWTWQYNAGATQSTLTKYFVDGRKRTWVFNLLGSPVLANGDLDPFAWNNNSLVSYTEGTYTVSTTLAALLASGAPGGYTSQNWQPYYYLQTIGDFGDEQIFLGGLSDIWTATPAAPASFVIAGDYGTYNDVGFLPGVYFSGINSGNMYDNTWTIMNPATKAQNGAYMGFITGKTDSGFNTYGMITALYLDATGNAGFLLGDYTGTVYPNADNDLLEPTTGGLFPTQVKASTGYTDETLFTSSGGGIVNDYSNSTPYQAEGMFFTDGTFATTSGIFAADFREANFASIGGGSGATKWGMAVGAIVRGGDYGSGSTDYWMIDWGAATYALTNGSMNPPIIDYNSNNVPIRKRGFAVGNPDNSDIGGQWSGGFIEGKSATSWMNMNDGSNGVALGEIHGLFDPTSSATYMTWETVNNTIAMDTKTFMDLAGTAAGRAALEQMNFPSFAVGKTNLAGTIAVSGGSLGMTMTDVTFYANASGSRPLLWATNSVTGSFTGAPAAGNSGTLVGSSSPNLEATVKLLNWNSPAGVWTADVSPSANATKVDLVKNLDGGTTTQVKMYGQAGGAISGTTITGTASGVNQ